MNKKKFAVNFVFMIFLMIFACHSFATEYYIEQGNPSASDNNTGKENLPWKTITKANNTLAPGDTVYIKAGTYSSYIAPTNSGTSSNPITYTNYGEDTVTIANTSRGIYLNGDSHIVVQGINFYNLDQFLYIQNGSNYNIIAHCNFDKGRNIGWSGSTIRQNSKYNWIHHSQFSKYGLCSGGEDHGSLLDIGDEENASDTTAYNLVEDNTFFHGGHHLLGLMSNHNTLRKNYFYNNAWTAGTGNRTLYIAGYDDNVHTNLIEENRFAYTAPPCDEEVTSGILIAANTNIIRYNALYNNHVYAMGFQVYSGYSNANNNLIYNNTFYNNCNKTEWPGLCTGNGDNDHAVFFNDYASGVQIKYNKFKNNLFYLHDDEFHNEDQGSLNDHTYANNYVGENSGDPLFVNASPTYGTVSNSEYPDFNLRSGSPAINQGGALTTVDTADTGSGTNLILDNASYFQDGTWGPPGVIQADWIAVGTVSNIVKISSISGNTVRLASAIARSDGDNVWLYKNSNGQVVLVGSGPDIGAHEYAAGDSTAPLPPKNLRIESDK